MATKTYTNNHIMLCVIISWAEEGKEGGKERKREEEGEKEIKFFLNLYSDIFFPPPSSL